MLTYNSVLYGWKESRTQGQVASLQLQCTKVVEDCILSYILPRFTYITFEIDDFGVNRIEHINWHWAQCHEVAEHLPFPLLWVILVFLH